MRRIININGTSEKALIEQQLEVRTRAMLLTESMRMASPHGRDYQLNESIADYEYDRREWEALIRSVEDLNQYVYDTVIKLKDQRSKEGTD